jgi:hypothetical protein
MFRRRRPPQGTASTRLCFQIKKNLSDYPRIQGLSTESVPCYLKKATTQNICIFLNIIVKRTEKKAHLFFFFHFLCANTNDPKKKKKDKLNYFFFLLISSIIVPIYKNASAIYYYIFVLFNLYVEVFAVAWSELTTKEQHHSPANEGKIKPNPR